MLIKEAADALVCMRSAEEPPRRFVVEMKQVMKGRRGEGAKVWVGIGKGGEKVVLPNAFLPVY